MMENEILVELRKLNEMIGTQNELLREIRGWIKFKVSGDMDDLCATYASLQRGMNNED